MLSRMKSFITFKPLYDYDDLSKYTSFLFDFEVLYTLPLEQNSDGEEDLENIESRTIYQTREFYKDWLIGGNKAQIQANVYHILEMIDVPSYIEIVESLTEEILDLKKRGGISGLPKLEKMEVKFSVIVLNLPDEDVKLAVPPASEEAVEEHLETVVVKNDKDYCVICMDQIHAGLGSRMPCIHVFHRMCGEDWLRNSGSCPVCRAVFPPEP